MASLNRIGLCIAGLVTAAQQQGQWERTARLLGILARLRTDAAAALCWVDQHALPPSAALALRTSPSAGEVSAATATPAL